MPDVLTQNMVLILKGQKVAFLHFMIGPLSCFKTSGTKHQVKQHHIPEKRRSETGNV